MHNRFRRALPWRQSGNTAGRSPFQDRQPMKRAPLLSLLLALVILAGMLALFPRPWMVLVIALLTLLSAQAIIIRRHLFRIQAPTALFRRITGRAAAPSAQAPTTGEDAATPAEKTTPDGSTAAEPRERPTLDSNLFTRFQQALESAEGGNATPTPAPEDEDAVRDRVVLSHAAQRARKAPTGPARPNAGGMTGTQLTGNIPPPYRPAATTPAADDDGPDMFADLRPPPPKPAPQPPPRQPIPPAVKAPLKEPPARETASDTAEPTKTTAPNAVADAGTETAMAAAPEPGPPQAAPGEAPPNAATHPAPAMEQPEAPPHQAPPTEATADEGGLAEEAATLLRMADEAATRQDWESAQAGLTNYLAHLADRPDMIHWRARHLETRLAIRQGRDGAALQGFEAMLQTGFAPQVQAVPSLLDELLTGADDAKAPGMRVSMLVRLLTLFRRQRDHQAMDQAYIWIVEAQEQVGDERRLLQYLKNHLEIRKALGDQDGQLELIDQLGNRCYRLGLTEEARTYYEMGLRIRGGNPEDAPEGGPPPEEPASAEG